MVRGRHFPKEHGPSTGMRRIFPAILLLGLFVSGACAAPGLSGNIIKVTITPAPAPLATIACDAASQCMPESGAQATWGIAGYLQTSSQPCGYISGITGSVSTPEYCFKQKPVSLQLVTNVPRITFPITAVQSCPAILSVTSTPPGASVLIDGTSYGTTPLNRAHINAGQHSIIVSMSGYLSGSETLSLLCDNVYVKNYTLSTAPASGRLVTGITRISLPTTTPQVPVQPVNNSLIPAVIPAPLPVTQIPQQIAGKKAGLCTKHFFGSGEMSTAPDGRINCTTLISTDDQIMVLSVQEGTRVTDAAKRVVPEIRITPVTTSEITSYAGIDGSRWTGHAYHFLPDHTTFDPPVLVSFTLSREEWERSDPANLTIQEKNETGTGFERLPTMIDPLTGTISAPARHFSIIGLFSTSPPGNPPENPESPVSIIRTATGSNKGTLPLSPLIPDVYAPLAAVIMGVTLSVIGTLVSGTKVVSQIWNKITGLVQKFLGTETVGLMNTTEIEKRGILPSENLSSIILGLSLREILVIALSALGFAAAFLLQDQLKLKMVTVIIFVFAGGVATILHDLAHKYSAYRCGCITEYQFWSLGTFTMLSTAWLFGNAFAKPSRTVIRSGKTLLPEEAARIKLAGPLVSMGMALVSLFLIPLGGLFVIAGSAGFSMNLLNSVFSLVPVKPNDGVEIYAWNKLVWAGVFIPLIVFYLYIYLSV